MGGFRGFSVCQPNGRRSRWGPTSSPRPERPSRQADSAIAPESQSAHQRRARGPRRGRGYFCFSVSVPMGSTEGTQRGARHRTRDQRSHNWVPPHLSGHPPAADIVFAPVAAAILSQCGNPISAPSLRCWDPGGVASQEWLPPPQGPRSCFFFFFLMNIVFIHFSWARTPAMWGAGSLSCAETNFTMENYNHVPSHCVPCRARPRAERPLNSSSVEGSLHSHARRRRAVVLTR